MKLFVKGLTVIDSSYLDPVRGMVGESYQVDVVLDGYLNEQSMLLDFGIVKKLIKQIIDEEVDHRLLIPTLARGCQVNNKENRVEVDFPFKQQKIWLSCPEQAYTLLKLETINLAGLEAYLVDVIQQKLPQNISGLQVTLSHEQIESPFYHYSHGLKKHDGNCQRIAHGHRSRLDIYLDGVWQDQWVAQWAERWRDIYLASEEDKVGLETLVPQSEFPPEDYHGFSYTAPQGRFDLVIPKSVCEILPCDTTVESISQFICQHIKNRHASQKVTIYAFEGIGKGAISEA